MDEDDQMMYPVDTELLNSEEEFNYPSDPQPSTSFFTTPNNLLLNSCRYHNLFMQQFAPSQISQSTIESTLQHPTASLIHLIGIELPTDPQLISSEYPETTTSLPVQSLSIASDLIPELLNSLVWDQWLCSLARSLTPAQWQLYWMNYLALFGTIGLPQHIANFFAAAAIPDFSSSNLLSSLQSNTNWMLFQQQCYVKLQRVN
ncbi:unnamed protein product [Acanthocheilonema viteae]|uniref:Uncharacterized protein n=1 Tax=Acanthocheilonema viteae TaxID=6277 RepID=A0A498SXD9_ACAVI|nr:unnamed protein product [Acanthocheilonema viteae]